ncbi:MAG: tetratricopeptide repeat protein [Candidatus Omnitrophica bacterium]|nr:tetratricopeptide repeat protein [Candidatus Omnitrophota bacterium]
MEKLKLILIAFIILISSPAWCQSESSESPADDEVRFQLLSEGRRLLDAGKPEEAIIKCFDKVIIDFESKYEGRKERVYCARTPPEKLLYLLMAVKEKREATAISATWADAYFMKGYALIELGRISEAKQFIEQALVFSPNNSQYLSELGYVYQTEKNWSKSLELFKAAEESAIAYSPEESKKDELGRARRGLGYVFVEMGQLNKAKEKYLQCLEADPADNKAKAELEYIRKLQSKTNSSNN